MNSTVQEMNMWPLEVNPLEFRQDDGDKRRSGAQTVVCGVTLLCFFCFLIGGGGYFLGVPKHF